MPCHMTPRSWLLLLLLSHVCFAYASVRQAACGTWEQVHVPPTTPAALWVIVDDNAAKPTDSELREMLGPESRRVIICCADTERSDHLRRAFAASGDLGRRAFVLDCPPDRLPLADGIADCVVFRGADLTASIRHELARVAHFGAVIRHGDDSWKVPRPAGSDDWTHPYHGPDNNPHSLDAHSRPPYITQFLSEPWYVPMPEVTVASGGRLFKAFGHIALKQREWPWLNKLVAINGFNGLMLWSRNLMPGFNVHRNTLIASPDAVYIADNDSCKVLNATTGEMFREIRIPREVDPGGAWKWMALQDGVLYAIVGEREQLDDVIRGERDQPGWPWNGLGNGYAGNNRWGLGRTVVALRLTDDPPNPIWMYRSPTDIDSRAACMADGKLYIYSPQKSLTCLDAATGQANWQTTDPKLMNAIGADDPAQTPRKGFSTSSYAKANRYGIYFAGPQRTRTVAVNASDGTLMWEYPHGNFQLVLRDDGLYAMGRTETSKVFDYTTGKVLADLECFRGNCTRATATPDAIFTRGYRHTGTMQLDLTGLHPRRIPLMRPACQDGVVVADGRLYWGPWMCDCNHSLVGLICLASDGAKSTPRQPDAAPQLQTLTQAHGGAPADARDWTHYRGNVERRGFLPVNVADHVTTAWTYGAPTRLEPTAPITVGNLVFWGSRDGVVRAVERKSGRLVWRYFTEGPIFFPPEYTDGHLYVGSGDGTVACLAADTGEAIWKYRVAPRDRRIMVHSSLMSNWPVGSGVLADGDTVYAAAGITSYDGTYVVALNARTGQPRWRNDTSGRLAGDDELAGVSVQGHLLRYGNRLYLAGGNVVSPAVYDLKTGRCLNKISDTWAENLPPGVRPLSQPNPRGPYLHAPRGRELFVVDGNVRVFDQLLYSPPSYMRSRYHGGHFLQAGLPPREVRATTDKVIRIGASSDAQQPAAAWQWQNMHDPMALAVTSNAVLVAGQMADGPDNHAATPRYAVCALRASTGKLLWEHPLPTKPVPWGIAVGRNGEVIVTLASGQVICLADSPS